MYKTYKLRLKWRNRMGAMKKKVRPWYSQAKVLLKQQKVSHEKVGERLNVSGSAVGHWLNGRRSPTIEQIQEIAKMVGKSVSELCGEDAYFIIENKERALIDAFRSMEESEKQLLLKMLKKTDPEAKQ